MVKQKYIRESMCARVRVIMTLYYTMYIRLACDDVMMAFFGAECVVCGIQREPHDSHRWRHLERVYWTPIKQRSICCQWLRTSPTLVIEQNGGTLEYRACFLLHDTPFKHTWCVCASTFVDFFFSSPPFRLYWVVTTVGRNNRNDCGKQASHSRTLTWVKL